MGVQDFIRKCFGPAFSWVANTIGKINWTQKHPITEAEKAIIMEMLKKDYYIIMTRHGNHLSTYAISLGNFLVRGKFSFWSHVLMNLEDEAQSPDDFRLVEAVGAGSRFATFEDVFGDLSGLDAPDAAALLKPKNMSLDEWTHVLDNAKTQAGKPYDTLFDLADDTKVSCVELVRDALMASPTYEQDFAEFEAMIKKAKNLTPQMFYDCPDFEIAFEIRKK